MVGSGLVKAGRGLDGSGKVQGFGKVGLIGDWYGGVWFVKVSCYGGVRIGKVWLGAKVRFDSDRYGTAWYGWVRCKGAVWLNLVVFVTAGYGPVWYGAKVW